MSQVWGGLLAEQMGLGKTLEVTALVLADKAEAEAEAAAERFHRQEQISSREEAKPKTTHRTPPKSFAGSSRQQSLQQQEKVNEEIVEDEEVEGDGLLSSAATLVVAPLSLLSQVRTDGQPYTTSARKLRVLLFKWICSRARLRRRRF